MSGDGARSRSGAEIGIMSMNIEDLQRLTGLSAAWDFARVILPGIIWWV